MSDNHIVKGLASERGGVMRSWQAVCVIVEERARERLEMAGEPGDGRRERMHVSICDVSVWCWYVMSVCHVSVMSVCEAEKCLLGWLVQSSPCDAMRYDAMRWSSGGRCYNGSDPNEARNATPDSRTDDTERGFCLDRCREKPGAVSRRTSKKRVEEAS